MPSEMAYADCTSCLYQSAVPELSLVTNYDNDMTLMTSGRIDREHSPILRLLVICEDAGQPALTSVQPVVIMVDDANDHAPRFTQSVYNVSVVENQRASLVRRLLSVGLSVSLYMRAVVAYNG